MDSEKLKVVLEQHRLWLETRYSGRPQGRRADLTDADLTDAVLTGAVLTGAVLTDADLTDADLRGAVLTGAVLTGADLTDAVLTDAVLTGAVLTDAVLTGAVLGGAVLPAGVPVVPDIDRKVLDAVSAPGCVLDMRAWHSCETTHCRAGWTITLAGPDGKALEDRFGSAAAGALIYAASRPGKPVPNFYASTAVALASIRKDAEG